MKSEWEGIFEAYDEGHTAILLTGRSLYDFVDDAAKVRPLIELLRRELRKRYGMLLITYSMAAGLDWDQSRIEDQRDRKTVQSALQAHGLHAIPENQNETTRIIRGISSLSRTPTAGMKWASGADLRFAFLFEFSEHLTPGAMANGSQTDSQLVATELVHITAQSLALRSSSNLVIFHGREGLIDDLVAGALHPIRLLQPGKKEKQNFIGTLDALYKGACLEEGLTPEFVAHLTANTPNRSLESLYRASNRTSKTVSIQRLLEQRRRDVIELSEHTLSAMDNRRIESLELYGINVSVPQRILEAYARALAAGDPAMPSNVLLAGSPGTGKTDLAIFTASTAKVAAYQMHSPKSGIVGETERRARLQQTVLREWTPNIAFVDEITEAMPLERSDFDGDSGASRAVMATLLTALSDESRRGKSLLIATTNVPWRIGAAMRSRFTAIPVLHPLREDYAGIILAILRRMGQNADMDPAAPSLVEAASIFYDKGASPRHIRAALSNAMLLHGSLNEDSVLFAATDFCAPVDKLSAVYSDLWAIKICDSRSYLPWSANSSQYPYPSHLRNIVDPATGDINQEALNAQIKELKPYANV
ncbi:ATP-binding protein [bacterium]|nr:ATP-binding protein [bacterium]